MLRISRRGPFVVVAAEVPEAGRQAFPEMEARQRAAKQLFVHPNTVRQRMRRTAELTGCQLSAPRDVAKLCLALEAVRQQPHRTWLRAKSREWCIARRPRWPVLSYRFGKV